MREFRCLGGDCEDTCCQHWDIHYDRQHYDVLAGAVAGRTHEEALFRAHVIVNPDATATDRDYAAIRLNENGYCPFLEDSGLCHLHSEFGIAPLSNICAFFPRVLSAFAMQVEMTGAMSCPEVVRLCLNSDLSAQAFVDFEPAMLPRQEDIPLARQVPASGLDFYAEKFPQVREVMLWLAQLEDYAFETRLYFLSSLGDRLAQSYHQGCAGDESFITYELQRIRNSRTLDTLDNYFLNYVTSEPVAIIVVQAILQLRIQQVPDDKLSRIVQLILQEYRSEIAQAPEAEVYGDNLPPDDLWRCYQRRWDRLNASFGIRVEECLTRYLVNCLQREWFISMPDPFVYIHLLCIRLAALRFLIASDPQIQFLIDSEAPLDELDRKIVELIYLFARGIDHNHAFLHVVYQAIAEQQMMSFDYAMPFIKF